MRALDDWNTPHRGALVRVTKRQLVIPLAALAGARTPSRCIGAGDRSNARLDVRGAYAEYCRAGQQAQGRENPMCPRGGGDRPPR